VVCDDVNRRGRAFEVMVPVPECFEDSKQLLIVGVVVQLWHSQSPGVVRDRCHAPNRFGTVNMEDNVNIKRS